MNHDFIDVGNDVFINLTYVTRVYSNLNDTNPREPEMSYRPLPKGSVIIYFQGDSKSVMLCGEQAKLFMSYFDQWKKT